MTDYEKYVSLTPKDVEELRRIMENCGINTSMYGQGQAKSIDQLFKEIEEKESCLYIVPNRKLIRGVSVIIIILRRSDGRYLREYKQFFHKTSNRDEYTRKRKSFVAEKRMAGERVDDAVKRALGEELELNEGDAILTSHHRCVEERESMSYPNLTTSYDTMYVLMDLKEKVKPIAEQDCFDITEYFNDGSPRLTTTWKWMDKKEFFDDEYEKTTFLKGKLWDM